MRALTLGGPLLVRPLWAASVGAQSGPSGITLLGFRLLPPTRAVRAVQRPGVLGR